MAAAPQLLRPETTMGLTAEEMKQSYIGMAGRALQQWALRVYKAPQFGEAIESSGMPRYMMMAIAKVASADGEFSDLEKEYFAEIVQQMSGREIDFDQLNASIQDVELNDIMTGFVNAVPEELKASGAPFSNIATMFPRLVMFRALAVSAQDGLERAELDAAYAMGDKLGVDREATKKLVDVLRAEQVLFGCMDKLMSPGKAGGGDEAAAAGGDEPRLLPQQTTAGVSPEEMNASYAGFAGFGMDAWVAKRLGGEGGSLWSNERLQALGPVFFSLVCIVAKGDGELSELEEKRLRDLMARTTNNDEELVNSIVAADPSTFEDQLGRMIAALDGIQTEMADHPIWSGVKQVFSVQILWVSLVVAAQDGLDRAELNVAYAMAEKLNVDKDVTRNMVDILRQEAEICAQLNQIMMPGQPQ